jgi:hypothetical protein
MKSKSPPKKGAVIMAIAKKKAQKPKKKPMKKGVM